MGEKTVRGGEAAQREEQIKELTTKKENTLLDPTALPKTHKLAVDLTSQITANSQPNSLSHLRTATNSTKMSTENSWSTSATSFGGHTGSPSPGPSANTSPNHVHDERQLSEFLAHRHRERKEENATPGHRQGGLLGRSSCHQGHRGIPKNLAVHREWPGDQISYWNLHVLLPSSEPGNNQYVQLIWEERLGAFELGTIGLHLPRQ